MAVRNRDPFVMVPGGEPMPWPPDAPRFTESARRALGFAQDEAARLDHNHVGAAHIFVAVVREPESIAAPLLTRLGVTLERARSALEAIGGRGEQPIAATEITLGPRGQRVMEFAAHESRRLHHATVGTEHLLLAAAREHDGFVSRMLQQLGLEEDGLTAELLAELDVPFAYRAAEHASVRDGPYENFDDSSKRALLFAQEEAAREGYSWVSAQDLVLGLARVAETGASEVMRQVLAELELSVEKLRDAFPKPPQPQKPIVTTADMKFPASVKLIIEHAMQRAGKGETVRPEHILLAIGTSQDAITNYSLQQLGATPERIRDTLSRITE